MTQATIKSTALDHFMSAYAEFSNKVQAEDSAYIQSLRKKAIENFQVLGLPTMKTEAWKYTSVKPMLKYNYVQASNGTTLPVTENDIQDPLGNEAVVRLVFVNGRFNAELSRIGDTGKVIVMPLAEALKKHTDLTELYLARQAAIKSEAFAALNTAFMEDGAFVHVPRNATLDLPVHFIYISDGREQSVICHPRNLFLFEDGASAKIVETHRALGENPVLTNILTEGRSGKNTDVDIYRIQNGLNDHFQVSNSYLYQENDSRLRNHVVTFDGRIIRNGLFVNMNGENCDSRFEGLYVPSGDTHVDNHTFVEHSRPNSQSDQFYKGVLKDRSVGVFDGEIYVHRAAQKTNAFQLNQNVLMDDTASVHAKPQLEIFADDVKCSHGATTGTIDEEAIMYLRCRGITEREARAMVMHAFAAEVLNRIRIPRLKETMLDALSANLLK